MKILEYIKQTFIIDKIIFENNILLQTISYIIVIIGLVLCIIRAEISAPIICLGFYIWATKVYKYVEKHNDIKK